MTDLYKRAGLDIVYSPNATGGGVLTVTPYDDDSQPQAALPLTPHDIRTLAESVGEAAKVEAARAFAEGASAPKPLSGRILLSSGACVVAYASDERRGYGWLAFRDPQIAEAHPQGVRLYFAWASLEEFSEALAALADAEEVRGARVEGRLH